MTLDAGSAPPSTGLLAGEGLQDFYDQVAEAPDVENAARNLLSRVLAGLGRSSGVVWLQAPGEPGPCYVARQDLPADWEAQLGNSSSNLRRAIQKGLRTGQPHFATHRSAQELAAAVPLLAQPGVQGILLVQGAPFQAAGREWLAGLARPLGRLLRQLRARHYKEPAGGASDALRWLAAILHYSGDDERAQARLVQGITRLLQVESGALLLIDVEHPEVVTRKLYTPQGGWKQETTWLVNEGLALQCVRTGRTARVSDLTGEAHGSLASGSSAETPGRSVLGAPLLVDGRVLGVVEVFSPQRDGFSTGDEELLGALAGLAAHALLGQRLIQDLKIANASLEASRWELLRSRNTLRALFDSLPAALYIIDRYYKLVAVNLSCAQRSGQTPQSMVGSLCYTTLYHRTEPCPNCRVIESLLTGSSTRRTERREAGFENSPRRENSPGREDEATDWEISSYPIFDETDQVVQAILLEYDITERRRLEAILAQSEKLAAVGQLAAGVAHEINNPLTAIIANAQLLQRQLPPDDDRQESIDLIARAGARATQVVRNLLDFARKEQYHLASTDINETVRRALALVQHELLARSIRLDYEPASGLPLIQASQDHLQGVWLNLLMNAIDAVEAPNGRLLVATRQVGSELHVIVADNGNGIPPERLGRIFEPFYTTKAPGRGTGLGLSVVHRIIKQHGGDILVDSQPGAGTTFTVTLPITSV